MVSFSSQRKVAGIGAAFPVHNTHGNKSWVPGYGVGEKYVQKLCFLCSSISLTLVIHIYLLSPFTPISMAQDPQQDLSRLRSRVQSSHTIHMNYMSTVYQALPESVCSQDIMYSNAFFNEEHASVTRLAEDISGAVLRKYALVLQSHTPLSVCRDVIFESKTRHEGFQRL